MFLVFAGVGGQHPLGPILSFEFPIQTAGAGTIQDVYPTISIQLNNFTKQDPEPEHAFLMY